VIAELQRCTNCFGTRHANKTALRREIAIDAAANIIQLYVNGRTGSGNLTDGIKQSKLEDANSQIEIILNNNITRLCNNVTAFAVMGIPDTHIVIISEKRRRKRSIENKPSGILRLAHTANRCLAYTRNEYIKKMSAEICAISRKPY
jgi:hypothetical protein